MTDEKEVKITEVSEEATTEKKNKKAKKKEDKKVVELQKLNEELTEEISMLQEKIKSSGAELVNYRKRKDEEVENLLKYANKDLILELLPIVDNFERAISLDDENLDDELSKFLSGFKMMYSSLTNILRNYGVEVINRVGEKFDSNLEQALMTDSISDLEDEVVIDVLQKGYKLKDRVIRPATVKINKIEMKGDK